MDHYNQVKISLKRWEQKFTSEHQRNPKKEDIDQAPDEIRQLYKEYRSLKTAKENCSSKDATTATTTTAAAAAAAASEPAASTSSELIASQETSGFWGAHLNRKAMPSHSPRLTKQDKDNLKASAAYYGLKLKNNLANLSKEETTVGKPVSSKHSRFSGRIPFNFSKDENTKAGNNSTPSLKAEQISREGEQTNLTSPGRIEPSLGSTVSSCPEEPEEPFKPFEPEPEIVDETKSIRSNSCVCENISKSNFARLASPVALLAGSPLNAVETSEDELKTSNEMTNSSIDQNESASFPPRVSPSPVTRLKGAVPRFPTPAKRLSVVDKKWLQRCQVFGEMSEEERPAAGNQEIKTQPTLEDDKEQEEGAQDPTRKDKRASVDLENILKEDGVCERSHTTLHCKDDTKNKDENSKKNDTPGVALDGNESPTQKPTKRKGRKRQRDVGDDALEDEVMGKKQRKRKKKEETSARSPRSTVDGVKNKKGKTKVEGKEKSSCAPKNTQKENLLGEIEEEFQAKKMYRIQTAKARLPKGADGNFVKINLKTKSHVKGYALRGIALRRQMYMEKFQLKGERFGGGGGYFGRGRRGGFRGGLSRPNDTCFKCGETGHWAINCKGKAPPPPVVEEEPAEEEPFELPTLEEVARATGTLQPGLPEGKIEQPKENPDNLQDDVLLNVIRPDYERPTAPPPMEPLYSLSDDGKVQETPNEVHEALRDLGYQSFRAGQEEAIMRILSGLSTLVVLSTGMGKSLCYQLPAYLYAQRSPCITLVISPLVSLMDDQLSGLPIKLKAACIHSNMTMKQREVAIEKVKSGQVCVLLLSPESLVGGGGSGAGCLPSAQDLPPVAFACIDEAHCVSEWSHNFRPCYLRLCKVLQERLGVRCLLGLTATATLSTALDIAQHLGIKDSEGIAVRSAAVPPNLNLSVSMDKEKDQALVSLLKGDRFGSLDSIIVYCTRRVETIRVAALLRTCLQGVLLKEKQDGDNSQRPNNPAGERKKQLARKKIRKPLKWQVESYHAGQSGSERRRVQNNFMCGELRIVVATVAFGMGLDKSDVRGIIHYNMPMSFESYVQEIGRAGRDGEPAHCHLFLDPGGADVHELRRHIHANTVDYYTVKKLVQKVFPPCKCKKLHQKLLESRKEVEDQELLEVMDVCDDKRSISSSSQPDVLVDKPVCLNNVETGTDPTEQHKVKQKDEKSDGSEDSSPKDTDHSGQDPDSCIWPEERVCHSHERAMPIQETVEALDVTEEGVETLLCYLELHAQRFVELLHPTMSVCRIRCYDGPKQLQRVTKICPPIAVVLARMRMAGKRVDRVDELEFDVVEVADTMGWQLLLVKRGLRQLQWSTGRAGGRSGILVEFSSPSFYFRSYGDLSNEEMDRVCQFLYGRVQEQERTQLYQLTASFKAFKSVSSQSVASCVDSLDEIRSLELKTLLSEYFEKRREQAHTLQPVELDELNKYKLLDWEDQIRADIRSFLANRSDEKFSGRAIARIFHGIGSPCYPAQMYGKDRRYWRKYIQFDFNQLIRIATQEIICFK